MDRMNRRNILEILSIQLKTLKHKELKGSTKGTKI